MAKNPRAAAQPTSPVKAGSTSVRVIGIPEILADGAPVTLRYRKAEALVYFLVIEARRVSRSEVIALLWPELPAATGAANLRGVLTELRGVLGPRLLADPRASWISLAYVGSDLADLEAWNETLHDSRAVPGAWTDLLTQDTLLDGFHLADNDAFAAWRTEAQHRFEDELQALRLEAANLALERDATSIALELLESSLTKEPWNEALATQIARLHVT